MRICAVDVRCPACGCVRNFRYRYWHDDYWVECVNEDCRTAVAVTPENIVGPHTFEVDDGL